jgi:hypothetical protein
MLPRIKCSPFHICTYEYDTPKRHVRIKTCRNVILFLFCLPEIWYSKAHLSVLILHENVQCIILASMLMLRVAGRLKTGSVQNISDKTRKFSILNVSKLIHNTWTSQIQVRPRIWHKLYKFRPTTERQYCQFTMKLCKTLWEQNGFNWTQITIAVNSINNVFIGLIKARLA